jgi:hypothetical protein
MRICAALFILALVSHAPAQDNKNLPVITPADVAKHVDKKCVVVMDIKSIGKSSDGKLFYLNSEADYKDKANFGVVIDMKIVEKLKEAKIPDLRAHFLNTKVRVTGTITLYKERPQLRLDEAEHIQVVERKK